ncbi:hypothetical protein CORC01_05607 [Colletotrichum orchidophilum]|uniref:Rhodopsin domain-containing protein n=1 Tax=Colletotrichum orchidophilum TaxID=1209926 RepID=A0A1G4BCI5_9PEZI|nr:uncharacterized protein CORC01_05607 [Colletotrichum orchidophilum]OHE99114.1 hypothetical protein CORC01_05607 [Colletotrichum orchidophilum]
MVSIAYHSDQNISGILTISHGVLSFLASALFLLRLYASWRTPHTIWTADVHISLIALLANHSLFAIELAAVPLGLGTNIQLVMENQPGGTVPLFKSILAIDIIHCVACSAAKIAVLAMYFRLFSASKVLRCWVWGTSIAILLWLIAVVLVSTFSCLPVEYHWDKSIPGTCMGISKVGILFPNIIFDIIAMVLPINEIWRLQMPRTKKAALTGIFLIGGSVIVISISRPLLFWVFRPVPGIAHNVSQTTIFPYTASAAEVCLDIIGACLPPCASLFRRFFGGVVNVVKSGHHYSTSRGKSSGQDSSTKRSSKVRALTIGKACNRKRAAANDTVDLEGSFERLGDGVGWQGSTDDLYGMDDLQRSTGDVDDCKGRDGIRVRHDIQIQHGGRVTVDDIKKWQRGDVFDGGSRP